MNPNTTTGVDMPTGEMTVNETIQRYPCTVSVFDRYGIDSCCGGALPITEAATHHGAKPETILEELAAIVRENA